VHKKEYIYAPIVPLRRYPGWLDNPWHPLLTPASALPIPEDKLPEAADDPNTLLRCANRVLLRELMLSSSVSVTIEDDQESGMWWFHITVNGTNITSDAWPEGCGDVLDIWQCWFEFQLGKGRSEPGHPEYSVHELTVQSWSDPMDYTLTAPTAANEIFRAAGEMRTPDAFGAIDVLLCLLAAHPATPDSLLRKLAVDPQLSVRRLVSTNPGASLETAALVSLT
jgi:hypothetical protein